MLASQSTLAALALAMLATAMPALAFPNGAPGCVVNIPRISKMGGTNQNLGYSITASPTYAPNQPISFTLNGPAPYKGLLLFVTSAQDDKVRVGNFQLRPGFKSNKSVCDSQGFRAGPTGAITHTDPSLKPVGTQFMWSAGPGECVDAVIEAVVAREANQWQVLQKVHISCGAGGGHGGQMPPTTGGDYYDEGAHAPAHAGGGDYYDAGAMPHGEAPIAGGDGYFDAGAMPQHEGRPVPKKPCPPKHGSGPSHPPTYAGEETSHDDNSYGPSQPMPMPHDVIGEHTDRPHRRRPRKCRKRRPFPRRHRRRKCKKRVHHPRPQPNYEGANGDHDSRMPIDVPNYEGANGDHDSRPVESAYPSTPVPNYEAPMPNYEGANGEHDSRPVESAYPSTPAPNYEAPMPNYEGANGEHDSRPVESAYPSTPVPNYEGANGEHDDRMPIREEEYVPVETPQYDGANGGHHDRPIKKPCKKPAHPMPEHGDNYSGDEIGDHVDRPVQDEPIYEAPEPSYDAPDHGDNYSGDEMGDHVDTPIAHPKPPCPKPPHGDVISDHADAPAYGGDVIGDHQDAPAYTGDAVDGDHQNVQPAYTGDVIGDHQDAPTYTGDAVDGDHQDVQPAYTGDVAGDHLSAPVQNAYFEGGAMPVMADNTY